MKKITIISAVLIASVLIFNYMFSHNLNSQVSNGKVFDIKEVKKNAGEQAHDFSFIDENGKEKYFSEVTKGKVVFLNFWGTWCPPCRKEIPDIIKLQKDMESKGLVVVGLALERKQGKEAIADVSNFSTKNGINYTNYLANEKLTSAYGGINAVPTTFVIDKTGKIVEKIQGMATYTEFYNLVKKYL